MCRWVSCILKHIHNNLPCSRDNPEVFTVGLWKCFLTGSNSTLHQHRWKHYKLYKQKCEGANIPINHTPLTASQPRLSSHLSRWFASSPPLSSAKLPWPIPSFSECELHWETASWLLCDETHPGQSSGPFEQWWDARVRVERGWHWQWCSGVIVDNLVVCWVWGVEELSHQFFEAFLFRVHFCCSPFQCPSWQLIGQCKGGGGSKLQFGRVVVTGVDPITIRQSLSTELVTAAL